MESLVSMSSATFLRVMFEGACFSFFAISLDPVQSFRTKPGTPELAPASSELAAEAELAGESSRRSSARALCPKPKKGGNGRSGGVDGEWISAVVPAQERFSAVVPALRSVCAVAPAI